MGEWPSEGSGRVREAERERERNMAADLYNSIAAKSTLAHVSIVAGRQCVPEHVLQQRVGPEQVAHCASERRLTATVYGGQCLQRLDLRACGTGKRVHCLRHAHSLCLLQTLTYSAMAAHPPAETVLDHGCDGQTVETAHAGIVHHLTLKLLLALLAEVIPLLVLP